MATYYLDENGKVSKKKKKETESSSNDKGRIFVLNDNGTVTEKTSSFAPRDDDIAPVRDTSQNKKWYEGWLDKGAFDDGYQAGDLIKTMVSSGADLKTNFGGGVLEIGEGAVDALAYLGGVGAKILGKDKAAKNIQNFIDKDLYDGKKIASYILAPEQYALKAIGEDIEDNSIWGDKTDSLAQSAGQLAGTIGLQSIGVPWWVTTGVTSFGGGVEQAFNEGANYAQAGLSSAISAGAEILSEKLFGGSGLGEKGLINVDKLTQGISSKVIKSLADFGIDMATEGSEEIVSGVMSNLGTALYKEDNIKDILFSEEAVDEYVQGFIGGAFLGGVMNAGNVKKSVKQKTDYRNGLTANEQKVFDKAYNDAITEAEKSGKKLTGKEKSKIRDNVMENLQKGYISTDTIEGVLGGETFGEYKSLTEQEKALTDEISQLENLPESQITVKQRERLLKAREELENLADKTELKTRLTDGVRNQINAESANLTERGSFLDESYKEIERRKQSFEADLLGNNSNYGSRIVFGDGTFCYIGEDTDDTITIHATRLKLDTSNLYIQNHKIILDDGEWEPSLNSAAISYYIDMYGWYIKVGDTVTVGFYIKANCKSGYSSTNIKIYGLPFTPKYQSTGGGLCSGAFIAGNYTFQCFVAETDSSITTRVQYCNHTTAGNLSTSATGCNYPYNGGEMTLSGTITYRTKG